MKRTFSPEHQTTVTHRHPQWWLRLLHRRHHSDYSDNSDNGVYTVDGLEHLQRSHRATWTLAGLFAVFLLSILPTLQSPAGVFALVIGVLTLAIATLLNRLAFTSAAAVLLVILISLTILYVLLREPRGLTLSDLPIYDLLLITLLVAAPILSFPATFLVAATNITLITADFLLQPKAPDMLQQTMRSGPTPFLLPPIALNIATVAALYLMVHSHAKASPHHISPLAITDQSRELATAMHTTHELTLVQHYQTVFFEAIATYVTNRIQGGTSSISLDFPRPRTQFEARAQMNIATDATRLNQLFRRLDISEQRRRWNMGTFLLTLRHYNYLLYSTLHGGDLTLLHPTRIGKTNIPLFDATVALVFATVVGSAPGHYLAHSQLPITDETQYAESVRESAVIAYHNAMSATTNSGMLSSLPYAPFLPSVDNIPSLDQERLPYAPMPDISSGLSETPIHLSGPTQVDPRPSDTTHVTPAASGPDGASGQHYTSTSVVSDGLQRTDQGFHHLPAADRTTTQHGRREHPFDHITQLETTDPRHSGLREISQATSIHRRTSHDEANP